MDSKRKKFLIIYAITILVILIFIMFIAPDSMFLSKEANELIDKIEGTDTKELTIDEQIDSLINSNYSYTYTLLDSMTTKSITYKCTGTINETTEMGKCSLPNTIEYTNENKNEKLNPVNIEYLDVDKIYEKIKDIEPKYDNLSGIDTYTYQTNIKELKTDIVFYSADNEIIEITIANAYMIYTIKINPNNI